ncbi:patatin-like phospholipase family protein [Rubrimonas cliftonensis]|uniref:Patatin-like phospholipase n=1 Tax=Rubrimonas cliftonensis TaxID=89524 RepID=A0A1H4FFZ9_9RHOB|nr:patatin-like phospholipase family protein [Rubrimonas cliftonensis]SEA95760.1 Patatin-like phospholipase [Rubrimonas cliftonensis]
MGQSVGLESARGLARARASIAGIVALALLALSACTTAPPRNPAPEAALASLAAAHPYGIDGPGLRFWADDISDEDIERVLADRGDILAERLRSRDAADRDRAWLALSGGGADGAFGAGLLAGWTTRGDRPDFRIVTGVSTGAIVALFAFLGPDYDPVLREIYTTYDTEDLVARAILAGLLGGSAVLDTSGYRRLIDQYIDDAVVERLAGEQMRGRALLIGTTNLDASRPVVWNLTAIAATGHPMAKTLIRDVIQASSAIPGAFPPQIIPVETAGGRYDEMHVDGGATQQVMLFSPELSVREIDRRLGLDVARTIYVIINNKLRKPYAPVRPRLAAIAGGAMSSLIGGSGAGDIYKIFAIAERDGIALRVTSIPRDFEAEAEELFDPAYMTALYQTGLKLGEEGVAWLPHPPDFRPRER